MSARAASSSGEERFWRLADPLLTRAGVSRSTMMGFPCLRLGGDFFASCDRRTGHLVVKLNEERVTALIDAGRAEPFAPNGRAFREWASIPERFARSWPGLLDDALRCSAERRSTPRASRTRSTCENLERRREGTAHPRPRSEDRARVARRERTAQPRRTLLLRARAAAILLLPRRPQRRWPDLVVVPDAARRAGRTRDCRAAAILPTGAIRERNLLDLARRVSRHHGDQPGRLERDQQDPRRRLSQRGTQGPHQGAREQEDTLEPGQPNVSAT